MTLSYRASAVLIPLVATASFFGNCPAALAQNPASLSFLPSAPLPSLNDVPAASAAQKSQILYGSEAPNLLRQIPLEVERRLSLAEDRFEAGKKAYQSGEMAAARRDFDQALDPLLSAPQNLPDRRRLERRLDELVDAIYRYDLDGLGAGNTSQEAAYDQAPLDSILGMTFPTDPKLKPKVKEEIQATASQLPLEENDTVLGYIHYFSTDRGRRTLIAGLRRSGRYRSLIKRVLDEEGLPEELISLAQAESGFLPRAVSYKRAAGIWQFMDWRGREYGLEQSPGTDDRLDPEKATRAAARHLRDLYADFGDWYLAMAAYNCGPSCVDRAVQRTGYADFWELSSRNVLPRQTENYVPLILAITIMTKNPQDYGLENIDYDQPLEYDTIGLQAATSIDLIADAAGSPVSEITDLNPALLRHVAPAEYQVHVPKGTGTAVLAAIESVPEEHRASWRLHRMEEGETLESVAKRFGAPANLVASINHCDLDVPEVGDLLVIPSRETQRAASKRAPVRRGASGQHNSARLPVSHASQHRAPAHAASSPRPVKTGALYAKNDRSSR